jgi:probable HAF family extracellular repeat protein
MIVEVLKSLRARDRSAYAKGFVPTYPERRGEICNADAAVSDPIRHFCIVYVLRDPVRRLPCSVRPPTTGAYMRARHMMVALGIAGSLCGSVTRASAQAHTAYVVQDLGTLGGRYTVGVAVNASGNVAGYGELADGSWHAFRWTAEEGLEDLGANGGQSSQAAAINNNGDVVGVYIDQYGWPHGFIAPRGGVMRDVSTATFRVHRVNAMTDDGRFTGMLFVPETSAQYHAFRTRADGSFEDFGGQFTSIGIAMNDAGDVTGYEAHDQYGSNLARAFRFSDADGKIDLGTLGGVRSHGLSINNAGVVVGWSEVADANVYSRAFRARPGYPMEDLGVLSGLVAGATGVNDAGMVVGWSQSSTGTSPFLFTDADGMVDLEPRIPFVPGHAPEAAFAIGNGGHIVVGYYNATGYGALRLTPVPDYEPPIVSAIPDRDVLSPPDGKMVTVTVNIQATDNYDGAPTCGIVSVRNSEGPATGPDPDVQQLNAFTVNLRATRLGTGDGRSYTLVVRCTDFAGNSATVEARVRVPHDMDK